MPSLLRQNADHRDGAGVWGIMAREDVTFACVRVGTKYGPEYVERLRNGIENHYRRGFSIVCLTDQPQEIDGVVNAQINGDRFPGWWSKMGWFLPNIRGLKRTIYLDLDTVIVGDLTPLVDLDVEFGICRNFSRDVSPSYPCRYGSCVMTFAPTFGHDIANQFFADPKKWMSIGHRYGDQYVIERLHPNATLLQDVLPTGYFVGRRDFGDDMPTGAALMIFAGKHKPHNSPHRWVKDHWE